MTAWTGCIGLGLHVLGVTRILALLFVAFVVLPETHFSEASEGRTVMFTEPNKI